MNWSMQSIPEELCRTRPCDVETLLVSGSADFSTPAEYAIQELLPSLSRGRQVILAELGHVQDVWSMQPRATLHLLNTFFATGQVDETRFRYQPMEFRTCWGFSKLAKIAMGAGILVFMLAIGIAALLLRLVMAG